MEEIKMILDEKIILEVYELILPRMKGTRGLKIIKYPTLLFTLFILYKAKANFDLNDKVSFIWIVLFVIGIVLVWFCIQGYKVSFRKQVKRLIEGKELPTEYTIAFNEQEIQGSSANSMSRHKWEEIKSVCENENYWVFGSAIYIVDKRILTEKQFSLLKEKSDTIKLHNQLL